MKIVLRHALEKLKKFQSTIPQFFKELSVFFSGQRWQEQGCCDFLGRLKRTCFDGHHIIVWSIKYSMSLPNFLMRKRFCLHKISIRLIFRSVNSSLSHTIVMILRHFCLHYLFSFIYLLDKQQLQPKICIWIFSVTSADVRFFWGEG